MHYSSHLKVLCKVATAAAPALALVGCVGTSPGMQVASFAGGSLVTEWTGKSLSDHALSAAVSQDCEFLRLLEGRPLCREYVEPVAMETGDYLEAPAKTSSLSEAPGGPATGTDTAMALPRTIVVLGRFRSRRNAAAIAAEYALLEPRIVAGAAVHTPWEVHVGPMTWKRSRALARALIEFGEPPLSVLAFTPRLAASPERDSASDSGVPGVVRGHTPAPTRGQ